MFEKLRDLGCDMDGALHRFMDNADLYKECYHDTMTSGDFTELKNALDQGNVKAAFMAAHNLKGVLANMGLTPLENTMISIVEPLRLGNMDGVKQQYDKLMEQMKMFRELDQ